MARIGENVQAGLGRSDYSTYLQGAQQGAAAGAAGMGKFLQSTEDAITAEKEADKQFKFDKQVVENTIKMFPGDESTQRTGREILANIESADSKSEARSMAATASQYLQAAFQKGAQDLDRARLAQQDQHFTEGMVHDRYMLGERLGHDASMQQSAHGLGMERDAERYAHEAGLQEGAAGYRQAEQADDRAFRAQENALDREASRAEFEMRAEAARAAAGVKLTPAQTESEKKWAQRLDGWDERRQEALNSVNRLKEALKLPIATGEIQGRIPETIPFVSKALGRQATRQFKLAASKEVFKSLRETLGAQFTEKEGERLVQQTFDDEGSEEWNREQMSNLVSEIEARINANDQAFARLQETGYVNAPLLTKPERTSAGWGGVGSLTEEAREQQDVRDALRNGLAPAQKKTLR